MKVTTTKLKRHLNTISKQHQTPIKWQQTKDGADVAIVHSKGNVHYIVGLIKDNTHHVYEYSRCPVLDNQCLYSSIALGLVGQQYVA
jgi:hypothetical protein